MNERGLTFDYDEKHDVMYITFGKAEKASAAHESHGMYVRTVPHNNRMNGITIINYSRNTTDSDEYHRQGTPTTPAPTPDIL